MKTLASSCIAAISNLFGEENGVACMRICGYPKESQVIDTHASELE